MTPPKTACHKPYMQKFKRRQNEQNLFLHEITSLDLLNLTLSFGKINGNSVSCKQTKLSNVKIRKKKKKKKKKKHVTEVL